MTYQLLRSLTQSWKLSQHSTGANPRTSQRTDRQHVERHTRSGGEHRQRFSVSRSKLRTDRMRRLSQGKTHQSTSEHVVNSVEVKQSEIIKKTVQRKIPIIHEKINQVSEQKENSIQRASTFDKLAVVPIEIQSPDPQDSAQHEAWFRQRSDRQRSISLTSKSRFLRSSTSTQRSMRQRCYKGKFQQPEPFTENSGDASGAVNRHRRQHFREQVEANAAHRHNTRTRSWRSQL